MDTHTVSYLSYPLGRAGHGVVHAVVLADRPPQLGVGAVLLQRVGAFVPEVVVDRRVPHRAIVHINLPRQVLERPGGHHTETRVRSCCLLPSLYLSLSVYMCFCLLLQCRHTRVCSGTQCEPALAHSSV